MGSMFKDCSSLKYLNLNNFITPNVGNIHELFSGCSSLTSLDISNFDTSKITNMDFLFKGCSSLVSLDLNNFNTSKVTTMNEMFYNCCSLISLDLNNFDTYNVKIMGHMFFNCSSLIYLNLKNFLTDSVNSYDNMFLSINDNIIYCFNNSKIKKILDQFNQSNIENVNKCQDICFKSERKIIKEENMCTLNCSSHTIYQYEFNNICYKECPPNTHKSPTNNFLCEINNINNTEKSTISNNIELIETFHLSVDIENHYSQFNNNDSFETDFFSNLKNNNNIYDNTNNLIANTISVNNIYEYNYNESIEFKQEMIDNIRNYLINGKINFENLTQGEEDYLIIKENDIIYQITTSKNHIFNEYDNISTINLGKCENILKGIYNIDENLPLIIYKVDYSKEGLLIPVIGYEIYHPLNYSKLDLNYCNQEKADINIPVTINEEKLYQYDPKSEYYNNECSPSTTDNGTDILLDDRKNEFINNKLSLCENNCTYNGYDIDTKKAICKCGLKSKELNLSEIIDDNNILANEFENQSSSENMNSMKCYKTLFTKEGIITNYGNYILIFMNIIFYILGISFYKFGYPLLNDKIKKLIETKFEVGKSKINENITNGEKELKNPIKKKKGKNPKLNQSLKENKILKRNKNTKIKNKNNKNSKLNINKSYSKIKLKTTKNLKKNGFNKKSKKGKIQIVNDYELNSLSYNQALIYDKRTFFQYYISLIRTKHPFIFSFCPIDDYNSIIIKISIFLLFFSVNYAINRVFFNESTIHKIYEDEGIYNFIYLIPQILYSFIISHIFYILMKHFFLSEKSILEIKNGKNEEEVYDKENNVKKCLVIKYICFYVFGSLLLIFFWYYISSFGAVFQNTQLYLIKNTLISFAFCLLYPFFINLIPGIFRRISLNNGKKDNKECLFKISKYFQII